MKPIITLLFIALFTTGLCQSGKVSGMLVSSDTMRFDTRFFTVELFRDSIRLFATITDFSESFKFDKVPDGRYKLIFSKIGYRNKTIDSLIIKGDTSLTVSYPPPCLYSYTPGIRPMCKMGHSNHLIPIKYGLPTKRMMERAKKGKVWLGGCVLTDCEPKYYCKIHKIPV